MAPKRLAILGVGLLGGSLGLAAKQVVKGCTVIGYGHRRSTLDEALRMEAIDEAFEDPAEAVRHADLTVLCTPVGVFPQLMAAIGPALEPGSLVTDVGSTKRSIIAITERTIPTGVHFVGSHPMAGSEKRGVTYAQANLFDGAVCITTPTAKTNPTALAKIENFWDSVGMHVLRLSPEEHDRRLADVSHLPHALAAALVAMQDESSLPLAGKGFQDVTRIAGGDGALWRDILLDNADNLRDSALRFRKTLDLLIDRLERGDGEAVRAWLDAAASRRQSLGERRDSSSAKM